MFSPVFFQWLAINREATATRMRERFGVEGGEALFFPRAGPGDPASAPVALVSCALVPTAGPLAGGGL